MDRRKSFLAQIFVGQQTADAQDLERQRVKDHVLRSRERRAQADRVRAEQDLAKSNDERTQARLAADARDQNEALRYHLRRLTDVLAERDQAWPALVSRLETTRQADGSEAYAAAVGAALSASPYPPSIPTRTRVVAFRPAVRELIVERELPRQAVVPTEQEYRVVRGEIRAVPRTPAEVQHLYGQLLARVALRTVAEAFALTEPDAVDRVVLNGQLTAVDRVTGRTSESHLLSVLFTRETFAGLELDAPGLDLELCLRAHRAVVTPHPHDVRRLDLLTVAPSEFETLVRELLQARGLRAWQTQASGADGVDAVAVQEHPLLGGLAVISAMRSHRVVPAEAVRALAGAMQEKAAATGILVTTSWVGRETRELARRIGRIRIIEGRELKQMLAESLNLDVLISLPVLPPGWERAQIA